MYMSPAITLKTRLPSEMIDDKHELKLQGAMSYSRLEFRLWSQAAWIRVIALLFIERVTLDKLVNLLCFSFFY